MAHLSSFFSTAFPDKKMSNIIKELDDENFPTHEPLTFDFPFLKGRNELI
jgi:hypothetical protein